MPKIIPDDTEHFNTLINDSQKYTLVQFSATWCGPCRHVTPLVENEMKTRENVQYVYIDIDNFEDITETFNIEGIPAFHLFKNGENIGHCVGGEIETVRLLLKLCQK